MPKVLIASTKMEIFPRAKSIADHHRYICECMFVKLRGSTGGETCDEDDDFATSTTADKDDDEQLADSYSPSDVVNPEEMPEDYCFSGMIAFFLWGFIIEDPQCAVYQSKQFQIGDSAREEKGANSRRHVKKEEAASAAYTTSRQDNNAALPPSPVRQCGQSLNQQIAIATLLTARLMEERRRLDSAYSTALNNLQTDINNRLELAKMWGITDRNDAMFIKIKQLMDE